MTRSSERPAAPRRRKTADQSDPAGKGDRGAREGERPRRRSSTQGESPREDHPSSDQERPRRRRSTPQEAETAPRKTRRDVDEAEATDDVEETDEVDEPEPEPDLEPEPAPKRIPARKIARWAAEQVMEMTGKESESVTSVRQSDDGWHIGLEVVESHRIPSSTDMLAIYEAEMDVDGELISYKRVSRYTRGRGDDE